MDAVRQPGRLRLLRTIWKAKSRLNREEIDKLSEEIEKEEARGRRPRVPRALGAKR